MTNIYRSACDVLVYDKTTGQFCWSINASSKFRGKPAGHQKNDGYIYIQFKGKKLLAHRLAWIVLNGSIPENCVIDHIDGNPSNNCADNLRTVKQYVNQQNRRFATFNNKSGFLGVSRTRSGWKAQIHVNGKQIYCGAYPTPELAHQAYVLAKRIHHEGCTI